jgi:large subunit ribosomal protein L10
MLSKTAGVVILNILRRRGTGLENFEAATITVKSNRFEQTKEVTDVTITLASKKAVVEEVAAVASKAISAIVADYRGLTVNQMTQLRNQARKSGVYLRVVRNTLARRAFQDTSFSCLSDMLVGPLFVALSLNAPSDAARLLKDFVKTFDKLEIKALSVSGKVYAADQLDMVASLPTRDEALATLMYIMKAPVEKFVRTLVEPHAKMVRTLAAIEEQKQQQTA